VNLNQQINWVPEHIKDGRFGNWLSNNVDWALGRERYWGTPLPVWQCQDCKHQLAVGSRLELSELAGRDLSEMDLHRPYVDDVEFHCPQCNAPMRRVPELIDVWFDSGAMPYAQWHYPFENRDMFERQFPADYISEAVDQTRGWFYSLHAISTMLFEGVSFKNVICLGLILDAEGLKMSKSRGNIADPWEVLNTHGADAFRWYLYTASPPGQERRFSVDLVGEVVRNFTLTLWNVYAFFVTYANLDHWSPGDAEPLELGALDRWLLSELHVLVRDVTAALDSYDVTGATRPIQTFVDNLSKWYLRRSRRRFWKSESDADKRAAYATLHETLLTLSKLLAPTMPFLADELYQNLARSFDASAAESVHLCDWPAYDPALIDEGLNRDMEMTVKLASLGHAARNQAQIKVRQPLAEVAYSVSSLDERSALQRYADLLADELNVKKVRALGSAGEAVSYSLKPLPKQLGQKYKGAFPKVSQAVLALDASQAGPVLLSGGTVQVQVDGETLDIQPDEVEVRAEARSGLVVAAEGAYLAALKTDLTPALVQEGLAREFVRRVQDLRKQADLDVSDRIQLYLQASPGLSAAVQRHQDYILGETLTVKLLYQAPPAGAAATQAEFDGQQASFGIVKAG
jgi:isoleucyl-tRNA synthetase